MELAELIALQLEQDEMHGFQWNFNDDARRHSQITKDLVGLFGEIGELSNIAKKINIKIDNPDTYTLDISAAQKAMREELADSLIYIFRIAAMLDANLETEVVNKINFNKKRYENLRKHKP